MNALAMNFESFAALWSAASSAAFTFAKSAAELQIASNSEKALGEKLKAALHATLQIAAKKSGASKNLGTFWSARASRRFAIRARCVRTALAS